MEENIEIFELLPWSNKKYKKKEDEDNFPDFR